MQGGQWSPVQFTNCTLEGNAGSFAILWMTLENTVVDEAQLLIAVSACMHNNNYYTLFHLVCLLEQLVCYIT